MPLIKITDLDKLATAITPYAHPRFTAFTRNDYGYLKITWRTFTGDETAEELAVPHDAYENLDSDAYAVVADMYATARRHSRDARYVKTLRPLAAQAAPIWAAWTQAEAAWNTAWEQRKTTPDDRWRAFVSTLVDAQDTALAAAKDWDYVAADIAEVDWDFLYSEHVPARAMELAGGSPDWDVDSRDAYHRTGWGGTTPMVGKVTDRIGEQHEHLTTIAGLTGDTPRHP
ncbi:hypothetical protein [Streptomyces noursei]|uniref:hypothetical protein n=1 Tax=Streptomyces noursei TaxID=1971 RepID=UPI0023B7DA35|nr:hypothetical protein [Streptomyces noursei]